MLTSRPGRVRYACTTYGYGCDDKYTGINTYTTTICMSTLVLAYVLGRLQNHVMPVCSFLNYDGLHSC
jgi:hypothetical protein